MEKILLIDKIKQIENRLEILNHFNRVYYGNEFCENKIPTNIELEKLKKITTKKITLITPFVTNKGIKKISELLKINKEKKLFDSIVANDLGLINLINKNYPNIKIISGRLISKFIINYLTNSKNENKILKELFKNITSIETNNNIKSEIKNKDIKLSYHYPYIPVASTRLCKLGIKKDNNNSNYFKCNKECTNKIYKLHNFRSDKIIYLVGNSYLIRDIRLKNLKTSIFSKFIFQPLIESDYKLLEELIKHKII